MQPPTPKHQLDGERNHFLVSLSILHWLAACADAPWSYLAPVLRSVGVTQPVQITLINAGLAIWNLTLALSASLSAERVGRRRLFFISGWGMLVSYALITGLSAGFAQSKNTAMGTAVIPFLFIYYAFYSIAWTPLPVLYTTEILPFSLRTKGMALFTAFGTAGNAFNQFVNSSALTAIGWKYYLVYIGVIALYLVIAYFLYRETKGLSIEEVSTLFDSSRPSDTESGELQVESNSLKMSDIDKGGERLVHHVEFVDRR